MNSYRILFTVMILSAAFSLNGMLPPSLDANQTNQEQKTIQEMPSQAMSVNLSMEDTEQKISASKTIFRHSTVLQTLFEDTNVQSYTLEKDIAIYESLKNVTLATLLEALVIIDYNLDSSSTQKLLGSWMQGKDCIALLKIANWFDIPQLFNAALHQISEDTTSQDALRAAAIDPNVATHSTTLIEINQLPKEVLRQINIKPKSLNGLHTVWLPALAWSPCGTSIASSESWPKKTLRLTDVRTGQSHILSDEYWIQCIAWSPNGNYIAAGCQDGYVHLFDARNGTYLKTLKASSTTDSSRETTSIAWSPCNTYLASTARDCTLKIWKPLTGKVIKTVKFESRDHLSSVIWHPDNAYVATMCQSKSLELWDTATFEKKQTPENNIRGIDLQCSHNGEYLIFFDSNSSWRTNIHLLDARSHVLLSNTVVDQSRDAVLSPDGSLFAHTDLDKDNTTAKIYNTHTQMLTEQYNVNDKIFCHAWSPNGNLLASGTAKGSIQLTPVSNAYNLHKQATVTTSTTTEQKKSVESKHITENTSDSVSSFITLSLEGTDQCVTVEKDILDHSSYLNSRLLYAGNDANSLVLKQKHTDAIYTSLRNVTLTGLTDVLKVIAANPNKQIAQRKLTTLINARKTAKDLYDIADFFDIALASQAAKDVVAKQREAFRKETT